MVEYILQFLASAITEGSIYALMGLGLVIIHRSTEVMFFAQGTIAMVGGVTLYALFTQGHIPLVVAIPVCLIVCVTLALASQWIVVLPLLDRGVSPLNVSIITIGAAMILEMAAMMLFGKDPLAVASFSGTAGILDSRFHPHCFIPDSFILQEDLDWQGNDRVRG
jgi:branched-chain amino acid transport system permease protein